MQYFVIGRVFTGQGVHDCATAFAVRDGRFAWAGHPATSSRSIPGPLGRTRIEESWVAGRLAHSRAQASMEPAIQP